MIETDKSAPVMVSGATGYVASWIVKRLLDEGFTVHAAVRGADNTEKLRYLHELASAAPGSIKYFETDLLKDGSYGEAMNDCKTVFHTASPFTLRYRDPQRELVEPALLGTRNVLEQVNKTPSVTRVVLTSSVAAIFGDNIDLQQKPSGQFTEDDWNSTSTLEHNPYSYSKTLAEREAWKIADAQARWDLVSINPSLVLGPGINPHGTSESFYILKQFADGSLRIGTPKMGIGVVDVRDVAEAHLRAAFIPEAHGRYIISGHNTDFLNLAETLLEKHGTRYPIPRRSVPKFLVWLFGPLMNRALSRKMVARNICYPWRADNSKSIRELGMSYRPLEESVLEFFEQLVASGFIPQKK